MAEPIPSASNDTEEPKAPTNAEDRKAAAALDSLNANAMSQENGESSGNKQPTAADQEALGQAMARLEGIAGGKSGVKKSEGKVDGVKGVVSNKKKEEEVKKKVKVDAGDVQFLVSCVFSRLCLVLWECGRGVFGRTRYLVESASKLVLCGGLCAFEKASIASLDPFEDAVGLRRIELDGQVMNELTSTTQLGPSQVRQHGIDKAEVFQICADLHAVCTTIDTCLTRKKHGTIQ